MLCAFKNKSNTFSPERQYAICNLPFFYFSIVYYSSEPMPGTDHAMMSTAWVKTVRRRNIGT